MKFRTKGRGKNRKIFPVTGSKNSKIYSISKDKEPRKNHSIHKNEEFEENPSEEKVLDEKLEEEKKQRKHKPEKPSFPTRSNIKHDVKNILNKEDASVHGKKDYKLYKKQLKQHTDKQYQKEHQKTMKRQVKERKKDEKLQKQKHRQIENQQDSYMNEK